MDCQWPRVDRAPPWERPGFAGLGFDALCVGAEAGGLVNIFSISMI
jgi:hypothetical protein